MISSAVWPLKFPYLFNYTMPRTCRSNMANNNDQCEELHKAHLCVAACQDDLLPSIMPLVLTACNYDLPAHAKEGSDECTYNMGMAKKTYDEVPCTICIAGL